MRRWLLNRDDAVTVDKVETRKEAELLCTEKGQVLLLPGERSVFDLNVEIEERLAIGRKEYWQKTPKEEALAAVRKLAGVRKLADMQPPTHTDIGRVQRDGYHIDKLTINTASGVPLPALTYHPKTPQDDAYLYLHEDGKAADGAVGGPIEKLVHEGYVVVAVDLRGIGETASGKPDAMLGDWKHFYTAYLLGQSLVGLHTEDALAAGHFVAYYKTKKPRRVHLVGVGQAGIPALHAAALGDDLFASLALRGAPAAWSPLVGQRVPARQLASTVHGALGLYDLPDLVRAFEPRKVYVESAQ